MRVFRARFALALGLFGLLFLIADTVQAGPFRNRRAARNDCCGYVSYASYGGCGYGGSMYYPATTVGYASGCCPQTLVGYGGTVYYPGTTVGYGRTVYYTSPYQGVYQAGYMPGYAPGYAPGYGSGLIPAGGSVPGQMPSATDSKAVKITDGSYEPKELTITPGTTVRWTNSGDKVHTVTSSKGDWDSGDIQAGRSFEATFTKEGTFEYYCKHHPDMKGTVIVKASGNQ